MKYPPQKDLHRAELQNLHVLLHEQKILFEKTIADACNHRTSFDALSANKVVMDSSTQTSFSNLIAHPVQDDMKEAFESMSLASAFRDVSNFYE